MTVEMNGRICCFHFPMVDTHCLDFISGNVINVSFAATSYNLISKNCTGFCTTSALPSLLCVYTILPVVGQHPVIEVSVYFLQSVFVLPL